MALRTVRQAAAELGIAYSTLKLWIAQGYARTTRTAGGHHRLSEAEIGRLSAQHGPAPIRAHSSAPDAEFLAGLSARNRLHGFVEEVRVDGLLGQVRLRVGDQHLTAVITSDAILALGLKRGDDAFAIVKSTEVMIARPMPVKPRPSRPRHARSTRRSRK